MVRYAAMAILLAGLGRAAGAEPSADKPPTKQDPPMTCRNLTKGNVVASHLAVATAWEDRRKGLLGRTRLEPGEGMLIEPCRSVHTVGMKFAIDIVFLDKGRRVVAIRPNVEPGCLSATCLKARSTLELPAGAAAAKRIEVGDTLQVVRAPDTDPEPEEKK